MKLLFVSHNATLTGAPKVIFQIAKEFSKQHDVTLMQATPATWRLLLESGWPGKVNLKLLCGGEALELTLAQQLLNSGAELWNLYGPTETTIWSAALKLEPSTFKDGFVPIGPPIDRKSTRLNSSHSQQSRMPSSA